jgi:hypothetical protein
MVTFVELEIGRFGMISEVVDERRRAILGRELPVTKSDPVDSAAMTFNAERAQPAIASFLSSTDGVLACDFIRSRIDCRIASASARVFGNRDRRQVLDELRRDARCSRSWYQIVPSSFTSRASLESVFKSFSHRASPHSR